ncbi:MAG: 4Fe-4S binding protein [Bacteroidales bacterium]|nr:4Fe-4S binding protein [Bacteroidales bacterium]
MHKPSNFRNWSILIVVALMIMAAIIHGAKVSEGTQRHYLEETFNASNCNFKPINANKWELSGLEPNCTGHVYFGEGYGYNGPVRVMFHTDTVGFIQFIVPVDHNETPSYFKKLEQHGFLNHMISTQIALYKDEEPVDMVSGATISSRAIQQAIRDGYLKGEQLSTQSKQIQFGMLELCILVLFLMGMLIHTKYGHSQRRLLRWSSMVLSVIVLGFVFNAHLHLSRIAAFLAGYFPDFFLYPAVYLLIGGSLVIALLSGKNVYCHSVCPFGSAQEILAKIGGGKPRRPPWHRTWKWVQYGGALIVLLYALSNSNPGLAHYEVFGAFFSLTGNPLLLGITIPVVVISLFVKRFWCRFICPIDGVFAYIRLFRNTIIQTFAQLLK